MASSTASTTTTIGSPPRARSSASSRPGLAVSSVPATSHNPAISCSEVSPRAWMKPLIEPGRGTVSPGSVCSRGTRLRRLGSASTDTGTAGGLARAGVSGDHQCGRRPRFQPAAGGRQGGVPTGVEPAILTGGVKALRAGQHMVAQIAVAVRAQPEPLLRAQVQLPQPPIQARVGQKRCSSVSGGEAASVLPGGTFSLIAPTRPSRAMNSVSCPLAARSFSTASTKASVKAPVVACSVGRAATIKPTAGSVVWSRSWLRKSIAPPPARGSAAPA